MCSFSLVVKGLSGGVLFVRSVTGFAVSRKDITCNKVDRRGERVVSQNC